MNKEVEKAHRDFEHIQDCLDAFGFGESINNGHLFSHTYSDKELQEAVDELRKWSWIVRTWFEE